MCDNFVGEQEHLLNDPYCNNNSYDYNQLQETVPTNYFQDSVKDVETSVQITSLSNMCRSEFYNNQPYTEEALSPQSKTTSKRKPPGRPIRGNAARERNRVQTLRSAFLDLQRCLPAVPLDTKLSKLDVLVLATTYIGHLMWTLQEEGCATTESCKMLKLGRQVDTRPVPSKGFLHPVKKWPMRTRLYAGIATLPGATRRAPQVPTPSTAPSPCTPKSYNIPRNSKK